MKGKPVERVKRFFRDEEGATMVEYALMVSLIAAVCIVAVTAMSTQVQNLFTSVVASL
ncbi:MAG: Flp family type IVb pilin [Syntrophobacteraceae bacterium]|jgi:pilus assembly protein Flp/PilA